MNAMLLTSILCVPLVAGLLCLLVRSRRVMEVLNVAGLRHHAGARSDAASPRCCERGSASPSGASFSAPTP